MECTPAQGGKTYAVLRPHTGVEPATLAAIHTALDQKNIMNFARQTPEGNALILPDVSSEKELLGLLADGGWCQGTPQIMAMASDKKPENTKSFIERNPTLMSALFFDMGSISWVISGIQRARHNRGGKFTGSDISEMMAGITFLSANMLLTAYGSDKKKHPMAAFSDGLTKHLHETGIRLPNPQEATPESIHKSGFFDSVDSFLKKNIIPTMALAKVGGGGFMMHAAMKKGNVNNFKFASGLIFSSAWLATFLLDKPNAPPYEFKQEKQENPSTGQQMYQWAVENPRGRITSPVASITNIMKLPGAWKERIKFGAEAEAARANLTGKVGKALEAAQAEFHFANAKKYDYAWNVLGTCSFLMAHHMFGKSGEKKNNIPDFEQFERDMLTVSANVLLNTPDKVRQHAIGEAADYMASIKGVNKSKDEIVTAINAEIENLHHSAFARVEQRKNASLSAL